jgi:arylsulfatase A-like enzyme
MSRPVPMFALLVSLLLPGVTGCGPSEPENRNVLFIAVDDLRDWTQYSSQFSNVQTPNLDKLAKFGMVFSNAYCAAPVCAPSRTALLSGKSPASTGVYENGSLWAGDLREHVTLTRHFMDNGYYVAGFGKIYHGQEALQYWHHYEYGPYSPCPENPDFPFALGNPLDVPDSLTGDWKRAKNAG